MRGRVMLSPRADALPDEEMPALIARAVAPPGGPVLIEPAPMPLERWEGLPILLRGGASRGRKGGLAARVRSGGIRVGSGGRRRPLAAQPADAGKERGRKAFRPNYSQHALLIAGVGGSGALHPAGVEEGTGRRKLGGVGGKAAGEALPVHARVLVVLEEHG